jgi:hypothetical protein
MFLGDGWLTGVDNEGPEDESDLVANKHQPGDVSTSSQQPSSSSTAGEGTIVALKMTVAIEYLLFVRKRKNCKLGG